MICDMSSLLTRLGLATSTPDDGITNAGMLQYLSACPVALPEQTERTLDDRALQQSWIRSGS